MVWKEVKRLKLKPKTFSFFSKYKKEYYTSTKFTEKFMKKTHYL